MEQAPSDRLTKLQRMLERTPNDPFLLYGIGLEYKKAGDAEQAIEFLNRVIGVDSGYCYAYHQRGLVYESLGDIELAKKSYRDGIEAATRTGDAHAQGEIEGALQMIE
jgi:tetratricopeptide (TPR) repeat protein